MRRLDAVSTSALRDFEGQSHFRAGSTDVGDVSWVTPTAQCWAPAWAIGTAPHTWQVVAQGKSPAAHKALAHAAKSLGDDRSRSHPSIRNCWRRQRPSGGKRPKASPTSARSPIISVPSSDPSTAIAFTRRHDEPPPLGRRPFCLFRLASVQDLAGRDVRIRLDALTRIIVCGISVTEFCEYVPFRRI